ncbi:Ribbon-helix-helix protein%2C copG family [Chlamydia trachomatis]|nr:Ribbon-helix-helix protein%2C copG family [Chlamydia trachomatis]
MKLSVSLRDDLVQRIDLAAPQLGLSRSAFLTMAVNQYLNSLSDDGCCDCFTCGHSYVEDNRLLCNCSHSGYPVRQLVLLGALPCNFWVKDGKLVNEIERTV